MTNENRREGRRWAWGFAIFLLLVTTFPYLAAFSRAGQDWVFTGFLFGVDDGNSYIAKMLTGSGGAWAFRTPYSTVPQEGLLFMFLPYLLLGKLAAPPELHFQLVLLYQLFRVAAVILVVLAGYDFIAFFEPRPVYRRLGTALLSAGGGLGWLLTLAGRGNWLGSLPLDFYSPETFGFLAVFGLPHLAAGRALLLWSIPIFLDRAPGGNPISRGIRVGLLWLGAGLFNPTAPAIAWLVVAVYLGMAGLRNRDADWIRMVKTAFVAGLISLPLVGYIAVASIADPFFLAWTRQNLILSPPPLHYLAAFGLYFPWAFRGARKLWAESGTGGRFPVVWAALIPVLAYLPLNLQRRLPEAAFAALVVLFVRGLEMRGDFTRSRLFIRLAPASVLFFTTLLLLAGSFSAAWNPAVPVFRPTAEVRAMQALAAVVNVGDVVLAPKDIGNVLPAFAPVRVVIGHGPETIGFTEILFKVEAYFANELNPLEKRALLEEFDVDYVFGQTDGEAPEGGADRLYEAGGYAIDGIRRPE